MKKVKCKVGDKAYTTGAFLELQEDGTWKVIEFEEETSFGYGTEKYSGCMVFEDEDEKGQYFIAVEDEDVQSPGEPPSRENVAKWMSDEIKKGRTSFEFDKEPVYELQENT